MDKVEAIRLALAELGEASNEQVAAFVRERFGVVVELKYMPVARAMLKHRLLQAESQRMRAASAELSPAPPVG